MWTNKRAARAAEALLHNFVRSFAKQQHIWGYNDSLNIQMEIFDSLYSMQRFALKSNFSLLRQRSEMQTRWDSRKIVTSHQMFFFLKPFFSLTFPSSLVKLLIIWRWQLMSMFAIQLLQTIFHFKVVMKTWNNSYKYSIPCVKSSAMNSIVLLSWLSKFAKRVKQ